MKSNFREWDLDKIDDAFGTTQVDNLPILDKFLAVISSVEIGILWHWRTKNMP